jgi:hypothetical protein
VSEAYYGLALANAQLRAAEQNLAAAEEFEHITSLLLSGGEVAAVDLTRAQLQTLTRRDELEKARANEAVAAGSLRVLVGTTSRDQSARRIWLSHFRSLLNTNSSKLKTFLVVRSSRNWSSNCVLRDRRSRSLAPIACLRSGIQSTAALILTR